MARRSHSEATRAFAMRTSIPVVVLATIAACSQLVFLKPPSVPREKGSSSTVHGPAYGSQAAGDAKTSADGDWPMYNRSYDGARFSPLAQINARNVSSLVHACTYPLGVTANMQSGIVAVGGTLYFTSATDTYAIDAQTCALRWRHSYDYDPKPPFDPNKVNRGVAYLAGAGSRAPLPRRERWARDGARSGHR